MQVGLESIDETKDAISPHFHSLCRNQESSVSTRIQAGREALSVGQTKHFHVGWIMTATRTITIGHSHTFRYVLGIRLMADQLMMFVNNQTTRSISTGVSSNSIYRCEGIIRVHVNEFYPKISCLDPFPNVRR